MKIAKGRAPTDRAPGGLQPDAVLLLGVVPGFDLGRQLQELLPEPESLLVIEPQRPRDGQLLPPRPLPPAAAAVVTSAPGLRRDTHRLIAELRERAPGLPILLVAECDDPTEVADLLGPEVDDYLALPFSAAQLVPRLQRLVERGRAGQGPEEDPVLEIEGLVGRSAAFRRLAEEIRALSECDATVLIEGETGTGKDLVGRAIHRLSARAGRPYCPVNCGALPRELVENELFGHQRAAFTGASLAQVGLIREAEGGTILFDEVDCLPATAQASLLRFVQNLEYRPLGSPKVLRADVRVLAATNTDLQQAVAGGRFRQDLYYRLDVLRLEVPPLRNRREDIPALAHHFLAVYARRFGAAATRFTSDAMSLLLEHRWPGNVRELEHVVERAVALGRRRKVLSTEQVRIGGQSSQDLKAESFQQTKRRLVEEFERSYLSACLAAHGGNIGRAARGAKKNRRAFFQLMRKYGIDAASFKS